MILFEGGLNARIMDDIVALNLDDKIPDYLSFGLPPDSELLDMINHFMFKLRECGILHKLTQKWMPRKSQIGNRWEQIPETGTVLGFENLSFPFVCLGFGIVMAVTLICLEQKMGLIK